MNKWKKLVAYTFFIIIYFLKVFDVVSFELFVMVGFLTANFMLSLPMPKEAKDE
jgi:hypothetical protein